MGLLAPGEPLTLTALGGGVSCDVWRADLVGGTVCASSCALSKLRVEADWRAPAERATSEVEWLRLVALIEPDLAPRVLDEDRERHLFVMEYLPPRSHPVWKALLSEGTADIAFAAKVGTALSRIHAATALRPDIAARFANREQFHALRVDPYLLYAAGKHPEVADTIRDIADGIESARIALMHGDVSPKNILCGPTGPEILDAETTSYGDPAFDLAFCLNHLLLKCVWHPQWTQAKQEAFAALQSSYLQGVNWEDASSLGARAARILPALLLARVDGKSPVEYLVTENDKMFVRQTALALLRASSVQLDRVTLFWTNAIGSRPSAMPDQGPRP